jgi:hypothetical protein
MQTYGGGTHPTLQNAPLGELSLGGDTEHKGPNTAVDWLVGGAGFSRFLPLAAGVGESRTAGRPRTSQSQYPSQSDGEELFHGNRRSRKS